MNPLELAQHYFDAWNRRDPSAVLATLAADGTYSDPMTGGPLSGAAFAGYMNGLFSAFPDVSFEVGRAGLLAPDLAAAQWIMRGTNLGSMNGLPPSGKRVELQGADFIRVADGKIRSVEGYFDSKAIPEQLGLQAIVQPKAIGPFTFGTAVRAWAGKSAKPGAFSVTALHARSEDEIASVRDQTRQIAAEMLAIPGFLGWVGVTVGDRMLTITAWDSPDSPRQLMKGGQHAEAMQRFFSELSGGGYTSVFVPERINTMWVRCTSCQRMADHAARQGTCACGAALPAPIPYW
jgi:steroid delta-isomerase-like uncharacterized protein